MHPIKPALLLAAAAGLGGCVADTGDEPFVIRSNLAPNDTCTFMPSANAPFFSSGTLDLFSPRAYVLTPLIESRVSAAIGQESQRTIALKGAKIDLAIGPISVESEQGDLVFSCAASGTSACFSDSEIQAFSAAGIFKFRSLFAAPLAPNGGMTSASFDLIPTAALREIRRKINNATGRVNATVVATATVYGDLGGSEVDGLPYTYPVTVCNDCVINELAACNLLPTSFEPMHTGNPCNAFQDGAVDCCAEGDELVCPAVGTMPEQ